MESTHYKQEILSTETIALSGLACFYQSSVLCLCHQLNKACFELLGYIEFCQIKIYYVICIELRNQEQKEKGNNLSHNLFNGQLTDCYRLLMHSLMSICRGLCHISAINLLP